MSGALDRPQGLYALAPAAQPMGRQDMLARLLRGNPDPSLPGYPVMQSSEDRGFAPMPRSFADAGARMAAVLRGDVEPTPEEGRQIATVRGFTEGPATIRALHASPHKFKRFDMARIGTGEGAQTYGDGLYFAENPAVSGRGGAYDQQFQQKFGRPAHIYEVNLNVDRNRLLDWDANLPANHPARELLYDVARPASETVYGDSRSRAFEALRQSRNLNLTGEGLYHQISRLMGDRPQASAALREAGIPGIQYLDAGSRATSGGELLGVTQGPKGWQAKIRVDNRGGTAFADPTQQITTSRPFQTQADAQAWADSQINAGTRNYVMFDDKLIDILRRYGIAGTLGGGAAATSGTSE